MSNTTNDQDHDAEEVKRLREMARRASDASEIVRVDDRNQVIGKSTRREMRQFNYWHRSSYVFVLREDDSQQLLVHKRVATKDYCPSHYDMVVGGVVECGESDAENAIKEVAEEIGVDIEEKDLIEIGTVKYSDEQCSVFACVFEICLSKEQAAHEIKMQLEEVESVEWKDYLVVNREIEAGSVPYCPDSIAVFQHWLKHTGRVPTYDEAEHHRRHPSMDDTSIVEKEKSKL